VLARAESRHCILWGVPEYNPELVASDEAKAGVVSGEGLYLFAATRLSHTQWVELYFSVIYCKVNGVASSHTSKGSCNSL